MKRVLLGAVALFCLGAVVAAQVNVVPQQGLITAILKRNTYAAVSIGLVPASAATDIFCIAGSSSKNIGIRRIGISGVAGTLVTAPFTLLHRATLDTGGTAALTTAAPNLTLGPLFSQNPAATATLIAYTANPTINDASPTYQRTSYLTLPTTAAGTSINPIEWRFGTANDFFDQGLDIPSGRTAEQYCLNLNATSVSSGVLDIDIEWIEN